MQKKNNWGALEKYKKRLGAIKRIKKPIYPEITQFRPPPPNNKIEKS